MRLNTTRIPTKIGSRRERWGFLWFPKKIQNQWRWLEFAGWEQERLATEDERGLPMHYWHNVRWMPDVPFKSPSA